MTKEIDKIDWPPAPGQRPELPGDAAPPDDLEDRIVAALNERGLLHDAARSPGSRPGWRMMRASLATAACAALLAIGVLIGRHTTEPPLSLTGAESDLYALLLFETDGYDAPSGAEAATRYGEYSRWVYDAVQRGQFVTGEDLVADSGWLLVPSPEGPTASKGVASAGGAPLSGIFFIRAESPEQALELARALPHLKHGGQVVVQKTIPTDTPPE